MTNDISDPSTPDLEHARQLHQARRFAEAAALYERILQSQPDNAAVLDLYGVVKCQLGDLIEGIALLQRSIGIERKRSAFRNLGLAFEIKGDIDQSIAAYREARDLDANNPEARVELAEALRAGGRYVEALAELRAAVDLKPDGPEAHRALGN